MYIRQILGGSVSQFYGHSQIFRYYFITKSMPWQAGSLSTPVDSCLLYTTKTQYQKFKKIFPEKEFHGLSPNFHIHLSVSDLCCRKICGLILKIYKPLTDSWLWKLGLRPFLGIHKWDFRCSVWLWLQQIEEYDWSREKVLVVCSISDARLLWFGWWLIVQHKCYFPQHRVDSSSLLSWADLLTFGFTLAS